MSKSKKRYLKKVSRRNRRLRKVGATDMHHIFYQRRHYNHGALYELRNYFYCKVIIPKDTVHQAIHEFLGDVPAPSERNTEEAMIHLKILEDYHAIKEEDSIEQRLSILFAIFDCMEQPTADALMKQLEIVRKFKRRPP